MHVLWDPKNANNKMNSSCHDFLPTLVHIPPQILWLLSAPAATGLCTICVTRSGVQWWSGADSKRSCAISVLATALHRMMPGTSQLLHCLKNPPTARVPGTRQLLHRLKNQPRQARAQRKHTHPRRPRPAHCNHWHPHHQACRKTQTPLLLVNAGLAARQLVLGTPLPS